MSPHIVCVSVATTQEPITRFVGSPAPHVMVRGVDGPTGHGPWGRRPHMTAKWGSRSHMTLECVGSVLALECVGPGVFWVHKQRANHANMHLKTVLALRSAGRFQSGCRPFQLMATISGAGRS